MAVPNELPKGTPGLAFLKELEAKNSGKMPYIGEGLGFYLLVLAAHVEELTHRLAELEEHREDNA